AHLVRDAGIEKDALGGRGLAGIDVRADADVAVTVDGGLAGHLQHLEFLEPVMREGLVGLGHAVNFLALFHGAAAALGRFHKLAREARVHGLLAALLRRLPDPAHRESSAAHRAHFDRHLVVGAAHPAAFHFDHGLHVLQRLAEHFERVLTALRLDRVERVVDDVLGHGFLPAGHKDVDELGDVGIAVFRIGQDLALGDFSASGHGRLSGTQAALGFFAPYLDRPCLRSLTPWVSRLPRTMWSRPPGRSFPRPPRISTTECSCRLWPSPPMYEITSKPFVRRTLATLRSAELGFFGVVVYTRVHTPRRWGQSCKAGLLLFVVSDARPLRT